MYVYADKLHFSYSYTHAFTHMYVKNITRNTHLHIINIHMHAHSCVKTLVETRICSAIDENQHQQKTEEFHKQIYAH
jgi:hypothetical protein